MSRRFLHVALAILALALAYHVGARGAGAQLPGSYQEVAVLSGEVADGGTIPLPRYADGTEAQESQCQWTVSPKTLLNVYENTTFVRCSTQGRTVRVYSCRGNCTVGDCLFPNPDCPGPLGGTANYFIIATRNTGPIPVQPESIGRLKARYRER